MGTRVYHPGRHGFTKIEIALVIALLAVIAVFILSQVNSGIKKTTFTRAKSELAQISNAANEYIVRHEGDLPGDVDRGLPPGIEDYLGPGTWPNAPWPGSVYDWDVFPNKQWGPNYQISIRFCPLGQPSQCQFPAEPWAADFDYYSSVYLCISGQCKAHPDKPLDHPGYCLNCETK